MDKDVIKFKFSTTHSKRFNQECMSSMIQFYISASDILSLCKQTCNCEGEVLEPSVNVTLGFHITTALLERKTVLVPYPFETTYFFLVFPASSSRIDTSNLWQ